MPDKNKKKNPLVIGLVGTAGSGKDTAASYIKRKYGAEEFRFSYLLVETLKIFDIEISRDNLAWLMNILKRKYGKDVLTKAMKKTIQKMSRSKLVVINGIRLPSDYKLLRSFKRNVLVFLDAPAKTRWQRVCQRQEKSDDNVSFKEFQKLISAENERHIAKLGKKADFVIINDGGLDKFHLDITKVIEGLTNN